MTKVIEFAYLAKIAKRLTLRKRPDSLYEQLIAVFPWVKKENYLSISTPTSP